VGTLPDLNRLLEAAGVDRAVVFAPFPAEGLGWGGEAAKRFDDPNEWLCKELKRYPHLVGFATINPRESDAPQRLQKAVEAGLVGAKVHPPVQGLIINDPAIDPFFEAAEELKIPIHIHTGVHGGFLRHYEPILLDEVAQRHPDLAIIIDHIGGYALFDQALAVLHNNERCYVGLTQCSGRDPRYYLPPERVDLLLRTVGAERIIYGLDYPWNPDNLAALRDDLAWVRGWNISPPAQERILGGNIAALIQR